MIDWRRKLCSRKFWMALIGLISGLLLANKVDAESVETISGVIMAFGSVVAYIIGEGLTDAAGADVTPNIFVGQQVEDEDLPFGDAEGDDGK